MLVNTDYLVVGAGATGLAFVDALAAAADVEVTLVDRQPAPGGHWLHAYPFLRLHTPSAYYGVNSLALGVDRIDQAGENAGYYERATGSEVREYFAEAAARLAQTGRVRLLTGHEHLGGGSNGEHVKDLSTGELHDVVVRRKIVDARYLETSIPATHARPFDVILKRGTPTHSPCSPGWRSGWRSWSGPRRGTRGTPRCRRRLMTCPARPRRSRGGGAGSAKKRQGKQPGAAGAHLAWSEQPGQREQLFPGGRARAARPSLSRGSRGGGIAPGHRYPGGDRDGDAV